MSEVYMDVPAVQEMAKKFEGLSSTAQQISKGLEMTIYTLKAAAFMGAVGAAAQMAYLESVKPRVDEAAEKLAEVSEDLESAVRAYQHGDALGATRFH